MSAGKAKTFVMGAVAAVVSAMVVAPPAHASIILVGPLSLTGNGFGADPRALTVQSHGPGQTTESGCIAPDGGGGLITGSSACASGVRNVGGDEAPPAGFPKQAAPTLSSLGITNGSQIGILFDAVQPQNANNDVVTINDLTLKLYSGTTLEFTAFGTFSDLLTNPGNGTSDYLFELDATQATAFDTALGGNLSDQIALDSTISFPNQSAGPDSYTLINVATPPPPVPEPASLALLGSGLLGLGLIRRRRV